MANITIKIGSLESTISTSDQKAQSVVRNFAYAHGATPEMEQQELLDSALYYLGRHMVETARMHFINSQIDDIAENAKQEIDL